MRTTSVLSSGRFPVKLTGFTTLLSGWEAGQAECASAEQAYHDSNSVFETLPQQPGQSCVVACLVAVISRDMRSRDTRDISLGGGW